MQDDTQQPTPRQPDQIALSVTDGPVNLPDALPTERALVMRPSPDETVTGYMRAIQSAKALLADAAEQIREARRIRNEEDQGAIPGWLDDARILESISAAVGLLPSLPTSGAALDGGCLGVADIASGERAAQP
jgi:hypothetical protein